MTNTADLREAAMYHRPFDTTDPMYATEPTNEQGVTLMRALVHWCSFYPERTVVEILTDLVDSATLQDGGVTTARLTPSHPTPKGNHVTTALLSEIDTTIVRAAINIIRQSGRAAWQAHLDDDGDLGKAKVSALGVYQGLCEAGADGMQSALIHAEVHHYCPVEAQAEAAPHLRPV